jgi:hypothetical protein
LADTEFDRFINFKSTHMSEKAVKIPLKKIL